jgi:putative ABC transport system permease protein
MNDLRFAVRQLVNNPGFTVVATLTLALGIGGATAIFSVVNAVLLDPVPGPEPDRLFQIAERNYNTRDQKPFFVGVSPPVLEALRASQGFFAEFVVCNTRMLERKTEDFTDRISGALVSPNFFTLWNVPPLLGRTFAKDEAVPLDPNDNPERDSVIVLSYTLWKSLLNGDRGAMGKTLELSGRRFTVIGVMPRHFVFPYGYTQFWVPAEDPRWVPQTMTGPNIEVLARLNSDTTVEQAEAMLDTVAQRLIQDHATTWGYPDEWRERPGGLGFWIRPVRFAFQESYGSEDLRRTLFGLLAAIGFVLLIVCANVANLSLARVERRQQEFAVRSALGAGRSRLMRQLLTESVLVGCVGGLGGLVVTVWGMKLLTILIPESMPRLKAIQMDGHVLGIALFVSVATGLLFGMAPALRAGRTRLNEALKQSVSGSSATVWQRRFRGTLVVVQFALALVLLTGAGLMIQSVMRLLRVDPGYDPENLLRVYVDLPWEKYAFPHQEPKNLLLAHLHERLAALPGVSAVGIDKQNFSQEFKLTDSSPPVELRTAGCGVEESDLFRAMRVELLAGRYLNKSDLAGDYFFKNEVVEGTSAVVVNETMARLCWPGENPIGKTFRAAHERAKRSYEVVGVVGDIRDYSYDQKVRPGFYRPYQEFDLAGMAPAFVIRTAGEPATLVPAIRRALQAAEPAMNTPRITAFRQVLYDATQAHRTYMLFLVVFAWIGLLLSAIGIYGVLAYSVTRRTREIGIRMALGAQRRQVLALIMTEGARLIALGTVAGILAAFWLTRLLQKQLFEVSPTDPGVFTAVVLLLLAVAMLACLIPARRAANIDPMEALRTE